MDPKQRLQELRERQRLEELRAKAGDSAPAAPEQKDGFFKSMAKDLYHNAPEIVGNTLGSVAAAPIAAPVALTNPAAGLAIESAGAGAGQAIGSLAKSAVQNGANLVQQLRGKEPAFPDAPGSTSETFKEAGVEGLKGAATPVVGKMAGKALQYGGKGLAKVAGALTGKDSALIEQLFDKPSALLAPGKDKIKAMYQAARDKMGLPKVDLMEIAEASTNPKNGENFVSKEIANPVIGAIRNGVTPDNESLIATRKAIDDLMMGTKHGTQEFAALSEARTRVNAILDKTAPEYRKVDETKMLSDLGGEFKQLFPDVSLNKKRVGQVLGNNAVIGGLSMLNPLALAALPFESPAVVGGVTALAGGAKKAAEKAASVSPVANKLTRAAVSKLLTK